MRPRFLGGFDDYHVAFAAIASLDVVRGVRLSLLSMSRSLLQVSTHGVSPRRSSSTSSKRCEYKHCFYSVRIMRLTTVSPGGSATETSSIDDAEPDDRSRAVPHPTSASGRGGT